MANTKKFLALCFFRSNPQDITVNYQLFQLVLMRYALVSILVQGTLIGYGRAMIHTGVEAVLTILFIGIVMMIARKTQWFLQTITAIMASESMIALLCLPLAFWLSTAEKGINLIPFYSIVFLVLWALSVVGYILKKVLLKDVQWGFSLTCLYFFGSFVSTAFVMH
ncbi:MAG: hypothetical protein V3U75_02555 [Methylococcaceae bacterium]